MTTPALNEFMPEPEVFARLREALVNYDAAVNADPPSSTDTVVAAAVVINAARNVSAAFEASRLAASAMLGKMSGGGSFTMGPAGMMSYQPHGHKPSGPAEGDTHET